MKRLDCVSISFLVWMTLLGGGYAEEHPVTIHVVDAETGQPVKRFRYSYDIISPEKHGYPVQREDVPAENDRGVVVIPAPRRLSLSVCINSPDYLPREWERYPTAIYFELKHSRETVDGNVHYVVFRVGRKPPFRRGAFNGSFGIHREPRREVLHFVPPGQYELRLWEEEHGWVKCGPIDVQPGEIAGAGELMLRPGAQVSGRIVFDQESRMPTPVRLVDPSGVQREPWLDWHWAGDAFAFSVGSLWPGSWTARVVDEQDNLMIEQPFEVRGVEPIELRLEGR